MEKIRWYLLNKKKFFLTVILFLSSLILSCAFDQFSKVYILKNSSRDFSFFGGLIIFTFQKNTGGVFGIFPGNSKFFSAVTISAVIFLLFIYIFLFTKNKLVTIAIGLQIGGALGNIIDRIRLGYVIDFIDLHFWPIFNFADVFIVIGAILFGISFISRT